MHPIKTTVIFTVRSRVFHGRSILPTYFRIASCMRSAILNTAMFHWDRFGLLTSTEASLAKEVGYFSTVFFQRWLPIILPRTITELIPRIAVFITCSFVIERWQWAGPKFHSLLSAHRLIGACFLATQSDKRMGLLTRLYGIVFLAFRNPKKWGSCSYNCT